MTGSRLTTVPVICLSVWPLPPSFTPPQYCTVTVDYGTQCGGVQRYCNSGISSIIWPAWAYYTPGVAGTVKVRWRGPVARCEGP